MISSTEGINPNTKSIDKLDSLGIVSLINAEDKTVAEAVEAVLGNVAHAVDEIYPRLQKGGRLIYIGAGTSGRLGMIDATECPPTYGVSPQLIQGVLAGGREAMFRSSEGMEDSAEAAVNDLKAIGFNKNDVCFAISASGGAAYVLSAVKYAKELYALTVGLSNNEGSPLSSSCDIAITPLTGPEAVTGSTRMKAGTSQKLILNMISTAVMIKLGRVHGNLMSYVRPTNKKLRDRAVRIICTEAGCDDNAAEAALDRCDGDINAALELLDK